MINDKYYSIKEVAKILKVAYLTVYRWVRTKKLTAFKVGKQYRIREDDFQDLLLRSKTK